MSGPPVLRPVRMQPLWISTGTLLLSILLPWPVTGQFHVIGPRSPVIAVVEEEIVLPCQLSPPRDAGDMEVRWYRAHSPGLVHRYPSPQDPAEPQRQDYRARAEVLLENATRGLVSLRVRPVHASDGGEYTCFFESPTYYNEAKFEVLVTAPYCKCLLYANECRPCRRHLPRHCQSYKSEPCCCHPSLSLTSGQGSRLYCGDF